MKSPAICPKCNAISEILRDETEKYNGFANFECGSYWWSDQPMEQRPACRIRELEMKVERLTAQNAKLLAAENACDERMRQAAERTGVYARDGKSWPECAADEIMQLRRSVTT